MQAEQTRRVNPLFFLCGLLFIFSPLFGPSESYIFPEYLQMPGTLDASRVSQLVGFIISCASFPLYERLPYKGRVIGGGLCCLSCAAGMLLTSIPALGGASILLVVGAALRGLGSGVLTVTWGFNFEKQQEGGVGIAFAMGLVAYGAASTVIALTARISPAIATILLVACPIASSIGCVLIDRTAVLPNHPPKRDEPLSKAGKRVFVLATYVYGFLLGVLLNYMRFTESMHGSIDFTIMAAIMLAIFLIFKQASDYVKCLRIYAIAVSFILAFSTLFEGIVPDAELHIISLLWAPQVFFISIIFVDVAFRVPGIQHGAGNTTLSFVGLGILTAALLPFCRPTAMDLTSVVAISFACIVFLLAMFLPSVRRGTSRYGFSAFTLPESENTFIDRRCDEIAEEFGLTKRELEVMQLLARGLQTNQISDQLFISPLTTKTHLHKVYSKTGVHSRDEFMYLLNEGGAEEASPQSTDSPSITDIF